MQALDWHVHTRLRLGLSFKAEDEAKIFTGFKTKSIILVESLEEYDLVEALKLIYGGSPEVALFTGTKDDVLSYLDRFSRVFTTWDPFDRNRI